MSPRTNSAVSAASACEGIAACEATATRSKVLRSRTESSEGPTAIAGAKRSRVEVA